jgi:hypothetical protein
MVGQDKHERPAERPAQPADRFQNALLQIQEVALQGVLQANAELTRADEEDDSERWSLWRGYRKAMLEILAVTDRLPLPKAGDQPAAAAAPVTAAPAEGSQEARPA